MSDGFDSTPPRIDDDRLLSFALGLDDDPELEAALAVDDALRARLAAVRTDLGRVREGIERIVPEPTAAYADLEDPRWAAVAAAIDDTAASDEAARPARRSTKSHRRPWWQLALAPAAVGLAAVIVVALITMQSPPTTTMSSAPDQKLERASGATDATPLGAQPTATPEQAVAVMRAGPAAKGRQSFSLVRAVSGRWPAHLELQVERRAAVAGKLYVLSTAAAGALDGSGASGSESGATTTPSGGSPTPAAAGDPNALRFSTSAPARTIFATPLPAGVAPEAVKRR